MKIKLVLAAITSSLIGLSALPSEATETTIEQMPAELETRFALSALPPALRTEQPFIFLTLRRAINFPDRGLVASLVL